LDGAGSLLAIHRSPLPAASTVNGASSDAPSRYQDIAGNRNEDERNWMTAETRDRAKKT
jgi:hypothetical protein